MARKKRNRYSMIDEYRESLMVTHQMNNADRIAKKQAEAADAEAESRAIMDCSKASIRLARAKLNEVTAANIMANLDKLAADAAAKIALDV